MVITAFIATLALFTGIVYQAAMKPTSVLAWPRMVHVDWHDASKKHSNKTFNPHDMSTWSRISRREDMLEVYEKKFEKFSEQNAHATMEQVRAAIRVAYVQDRQGNYEKAIDTYQMVLRLSKDLGFEPSASIFHNLALSYSHTGYTLKARQTIEKGLKAMKANDDLLGLALLYYCRAGMLLIRGFLHRAADA